LALTYVSFRDDSLGAVRTVRVDGTQPRAITSRPGHYIEPRFSNDGRQIVFRRIGDGLRDRSLRDPGVCIAPRSAARRAGDGGGAEPRSLFWAASGRAALISVNLNGSDRRVRLGESSTQFVPSPDERYVAWVASTPTSRRWRRQAQA
jgi:hypothetical protein